MKQKEFINKKQSGVTLLLSVLIMSTLTLVVAAVSSFTVQEIRSSRANILSEPAYDAAETGAEAGLYNIKHNNADAIARCDGTIDFSGSSSTNAGSQICKTFGEGTFNLIPGQDTIFYLYDPDNFNTNIDLLSYPYDNVTVTNKSGDFSIEIRITRLDGTPVTPGSVLVPPGGTTPIGIPQVGPGAEGRMEVTMSSPVGPATASVTTNQGLPDFLSLIADGCSARSTLTSCAAAGKELFNRRIQVSVGNSTQQTTSAALGVNLTATPSSGFAPLSVTLAAIVSGSATGDVDYSIWWNCTDSSNSTTAVWASCGNLTIPAVGTCSSNANGVKCNSIPDTSYSISHTYNTASTAKVIVERGTSVPVEDREAISPSSTSTSLVTGSSVQAGNTISVSWGNIPSPTVDDWIGLFSSSSVADTASISYARVRPTAGVCTTTATGASASGTCSYTIPAGTAAGSTYEFRLFSNSTFNKLATSSSFTVAP